MYLDPWMIFVLALTYGFCAWWNHTKGIKRGIMSVLAGLELQKIICITNEGKVIPYRSSLYPVKRRKKST